MPNINLRTEGYTSGPVVLITAPSLAGSSGSTPEYFVTVNKFSPVKYTRRLEMWYCGNLKL